MEKAVAVMVSSEITTLCHWSDQLARLARAPAGGQSCGERLLMEDAGKAEVLPVCFVSVFLGAVCSLAVPRGSRGTEFFNPSSKKHFLVWWGMLSHPPLLSLHECSVNQIFYVLYTNASFNTGLCEFFPLYNLPSRVLSLINLKALSYSKTCYTLSLCYT